MQYFFVIAKNYDKIFDPRRSKFWNCSAKPRAISFSMHCVTFQLASGKKSGKKEKKQSFFQSEIYPRFFEILQRQQPQTKHWL